MRDFTTKRDDSAPGASGRLTAAEDNVRNLELESAVSVSGQALDPAQGPDTRTNMLAESMTRHASGALWVTDSGTANTYVVTMVGGYVSPRVLFAGLTVRFRPGNANTGAATLNAFGLGARAIVTHTLSPLSSGDMDGRMISLVYDPTVGSGSWILPSGDNARYAALMTSSSEPAPTLQDGEGWEIDGSNRGNLNFPGLTAAVPVGADTFAFYDQSARRHRNANLSALAALLGGGGGLLNMQIITSSSTYTKTTGTRRILVIATGGGGGGCVAYRTTNTNNIPFAIANRGGAGGGGGATVIQMIDVSSIARIAVVIGVGGTAGSGSGGNEGTDGGTTTFGTFIEARGGGRASVGLVNQFGTRSDVRGGEAGEAAVGNLKLHGQRGEAHPGNGGGTFWGPGGSAGRLPAADEVPSNFGGFDALTYGGGGAGVPVRETESSNNSSMTAGNGHAGVVVVLEFA